MYKLEVALKQHTPLIHFQHDQEGATLRASEVKPKLDKFIQGSLKELKPEIYEEYEKLMDSVLDGSNEVNSLPYKLSIQLQDENAVGRYVIGSYIPKYKWDDYKSRGCDILDRTPYFADNKPLKDGLKADAEYKLGLMLKENNTLILTFRFWDTKWKEFLRKVIPLFFAVTNFGTRQNKGFGCFYPIDGNQKELEKGLRDFSPDALYRSSRSFDMTRAFKEIDDIYKKLKSGVQGSESELRRYFNKRIPMVEWEKPAIQNKIQEITHQNLRISSKTTNQQFVRAVLGLPEIYEYPKSNVKVQVKSKSDNEEDKIERYASPISFKVFDGYIYMFVGEKTSKITNKLFGFEFSHDGRNYGEMLSPLKTPESFDVCDFLNATMNYQYSWKKV
jgi:hypothetical protein